MLAADVTARERGRRADQRAAAMVAGFLFRDPSLAVMAMLAHEARATMALRPRPESLRSEAARRGVTVYRVRVDRAAREGVPARQAVGHRGGVKVARSAQRIRSARGVEVASTTAAGTAALRNRYHAAQALDFARRNGVRASEAEARFRLPSGTLRREFPGSVRRGRVVGSSDRERVAVPVTGPDGGLWVLTAGSRSRALAREHRAAVRHFIDTGDASLLQKFSGKSVAGIELETDPERLEFLAASEQIDPFGISPEVDAA